MTRAQRQIAAVSSAVRGITKCKDRAIKSGCLPFPREAAKTSQTKKLANNTVIDMFVSQGLGTTIRNAVIVVLDTPDLRTTRQLLKRERVSISKIIIVEKSATVYQGIIRQLATSRPGKVEVVQGDVIDYLAARASRVDFAWLDFMAAYVDENNMLPAIVSRLSIRCIAITLSNRLYYGGTHSNRAKQFKRRFNKVLTYKICDMGYKTSSTTQCMQVLAFGNINVGCTYGVRNVVSIRGDTSHVKVYWMGYGSEHATIESGTIEEWRQS